VYVRAKGDHAEILSFMCTATQPVEMWRSKGISTIIEIFYNVPHVEKAICKYCSEHSVDCVFMGKKGLHAIQGFFGESTSKYCSGNAPCEVKVVKLFSREEKADNHLGEILRETSYDETPLLLAQSGGIENR